VAQGENASAGFGYTGGEIPPPVEVLSASIPIELNLRVVSGFITNSDGELSDQIDCMLVQGEGERIPYTDDFKYNIDNVIAVIEVKKNLYSKEIESAYENLLRSHP
jgi:hypothetical protein